MTLTERVMTLADRISALTPDECRALLIYMCGRNPQATAEMLDAHNAVTHGVTHGVTR